MKLNQANIPSLPSGVGDRARPRVHRSAPRRPKQVCGPCPASRDRSRKAVLGSIHPVFRRTVNRRTPPETAKNPEMTIMTQNASLTRPLSRRSPAKADCRVESRSEREKTDPPTINCPVRGAGRISATLCFTIKKNTKKSTVLLFVRRY